MKYDPTRGFDRSLEERIEAANAQILRQGLVIDALVEALGPAGDEVFGMILEQLDASD